MSKRFIDVDDFRKNAYYKDTIIDIDVYITEHGYADVVEVVRCRDCKFRDAKGCPRMFWNNNDNDFCSNGERRTEE